MVVVAAVANLTRVFAGSKPLQPASLPVCHLWTYGNSQLIIIFYSTAPVKLPISHLSYETLLICVSSCISVGNDDNDAEEKDFVA
jgi:hypothetical protein